MSNNFLLHDLEEIEAIIPRRQFADLDVRNLSKDEIALVCDYAITVLPRETLQDDFAVFRLSAEHIKKLYKKLSKYDLILAPGDSPSKYVLCLKLCGYDLPVVQFPLSGLGEPEKISSATKDVLDTYLSYLLSSYTSASRIAIFDYSSSGATFRYLSESIRDILGKHVLIEAVEIPDTSGQDGYKHTYKYANEHTSLMLEGDRYCTRCVSKFNIRDEQGDYPPLLAKDSAMKCNVICMMVALAYFRLLPKAPKIPQFEIEPAIYEATYYASSRNEIVFGLIKVNYGQEFTPIDDPNQYMQKDFGFGCTPFMSLVELGKRLSINENDLQAFVNQFVHVKLVNDMVIEVYIGKYDIYVDLEEIHPDKPAILKLAHEEVYYGRDTPRVLRLEDKYYLFNRIDREWIAAII